MHVPALFYHMYPIDIYNACKKKSVADLRGSPPRIYWKLDVDVIPYLRPWTAAHVC